MGETIEVIYFGLHVASIEKGLHGSVVWSRVPACTQTAPRGGTAGYISLYVDTGESGARGKFISRRVARALIHRVSLITSILFILITINSDLLNPPPHTDPTGHTVPYTLSPATVSNSPSWSSAPPASPVKPSSSLLAWSANPLFLAGTLRELRSGAHCFRVADCNSREEARVYHLASRHRHGRGFRFVYPDE